MNTKRMRIAFAVLALGIAPAAMAETACSADVPVPMSARVFAKVNDQSGWNEYRSFDKVPKLEPQSGMYALYWFPKKKNPSVYIVQLEQSFYIQTRYCYNNEGKLLGVDYEIGTSLGWGHRQEGAVANDGFDASKVEFFRTVDGKGIGRPFGPSNPPRALKPTLYLTTGELPFASFLEPSMASKKKASSAGAGDALAARGR